MEKRYEDLTPRAFQDCNADAKHLIAALLKAARPRDRAMLSQFLNHQMTPLPVCVGWFVRGVYHADRPDSFQGCSDVHLELVAPFLSAGVLARAEYGVSQAMKELEILFTTFHSMQRVMGRL